MPTRQAGIAVNSNCSDSIARMSRWRAPRQRSTATVSMRRIANRFAASAVATPDSNTASNADRARKRPARSNAARMPRWVSSMPTSRYSLARGLSQARRSAMACGVPANINR